MYCMKFSNMRYIFEEKFPLKEQPCWPKFTSDSGPSETSALTVALRRSVARFPSFYCIYMSLCSFFLLQFLSRESGHIIKEILWLSLVLLFENQTTLCDWWKSETIPITSHNVSVSCFETTKFLMIKIFYYIIEQRHKCDCRKLHKIQKSYWQEKFLPIFPLQILSVCKRLWPSINP